MAKDSVKDSARGQNLGRRGVDSSVQQRCRDEAWLHCENPRLALSRLQREVGSRAINLAPRKFQEEDKEP